MSDSGSNGGQLALRSALAFSTCASFAIAPPFGILISATLAAFEVGLSDLFGAEQATSLTVEKIDQAFLNQIERAEIRAALATIGSYRDWFFSYALNKISLPTDLEKELRLNPAGDFTTFYMGMHSALTDPDSKLLGAISLMQQTVQPDEGYLTMQAKYMPAFQLGVSFYLLMYTYYEMLTVRITKRANQAEIQSMINRLQGVPGKLQGWVEFAQKAIAEQNTRLQRRLDLITPATAVTYTGHTYCGYMVSMPCPTNVSGVYFADRGTPKAKSDNLPLRRPFDGDDSFPADTVFCIPKLSAGDNPVDNVQNTVRPVYCARVKQDCMDATFDPSFADQTVSKWLATRDKLASASSFKEEPEHEPAAVA